MRCRREIGWLVAQGYRWGRRRTLEALRSGRARLPVAFHAAEAWEVAQVLGWFQRAGVLAQVDLTFDDGWKPFAETVRVLEAFEKPATLFIAPGQTLRGRVWTDGTTVPQRQALYALGEAARNAQLRAWGIDQARHLLTREEVCALARHPLVQVGNHTWSHVSCPHRPLAEVLDEVDRAQAELTAWCGYAPKAFAYPFGRGTAELDAAVRARGLVPYYTRPGLTVGEPGAARNLFYEGMSLAENVGRLLMAWPKVGETL